MPPPVDRAEMSTIIPRHLLRRLTGWVERRIPLRWWDPLNHFLVQTRLIFSRAIVLLVAALLALFAWMAIGKEIFEERPVFILLSMQTAILAILLDMNLWEVEREGRTFELLIMRIPTTRALIWYKLRVSLFWILALSLPFFAAFAWFVSIPLGRIALMMLFCLSFAAMVAMGTCIIASFVHHGLTTGIVTFILTWIVIGFFEDAGLPWIDYYRPYLNPFHLRTPDLTTAKTVWVLTFNRAVTLLVAAGLYAWLKRRLEKTEKWIQ